MSITISHTRLDMMARCGEQVRRRYVEGEIRPPAVAMLVGSAVDRSVDQNLLAKRAGAVAPRGALLDTARDALVERWEAESPEMTPEERALGEAGTRGRAIDKATRLAGLHADELAPGIDPVHIQRGFELPLEGYPASVVGWLDIQEPDAIRDTKTTARTPKPDTAEKSTQLTLYALAAKALDGEVPEAVALDYLVDIKTPKALTLRSQRTAEDFGGVFARIERYIQAWESGVFYPARPDDWVCSERWCGYWHTCRFARKPVTIGAR